MSNFSATAQNITRATGGNDLSVDAINTGEFTTISGPSIRETASGQLEQGGTVVLALPAGYEWNTNSNVTITIETTGANTTDLQVSLSSISSSEATFNIDNESVTRGNGWGPGRVDIEGLELRPANADVPDEDQISNTGTTGPDVNYGNLSKTPGAPEEVRVETQPDGSGQLVQTQDLFAGVELQVYSIARDFAGNFVENIALSNESDWNLINTTGDIPGAALEPSNNLRNATFSTEQTGSAQIEAASSNLTVTPSETITVLPREADEMILTTDPPGTATAGEAFNPQPVIELRDLFGNTVTTDNSTQVTASINSGSDNLQGGVTQQANNGIITFDNLSYQTAESISLLFANPILDNLISDEITVQPAAASDLTYLEQPTNTAQNSTIDPPVELQLLDEFGNIVQESGITISVSTAGGEDIFKNSSTLDLPTESDGTATFNSLNIQNNAITDEYQLNAEFTGINSTVTSDPFNIISATDLAKFEITATNDTEIQEQEAGVPFDIKIRAVDGNGDLFTSFNQSVTITADADISDGDGETADFTDGELSSHSITLISSGTTRIYAENTDVSRDGRSNEFNVTPTDLNITETTVSADPMEITADGSSTSTVMVQAKDEFGNNLESGGETIEIVTNNGTLSSDNGNGQTALEATDNVDGTYTAELTSSTSVETATVEAFLDNQNGDKLGETNVVFTSGDLDSFAILVPQNNGEPTTQTAGVPFDITIQALDANNNILNNFDGDLLFSSNSNISSGDTADGSNFSNGELTHSISLIESGEDITISVEEDNLNDETGISETFQVVHGNPDAGTSQVSTNPAVIQNDGTSESVISIVLQDEFGNRVFTQENVSLSLEQLEEDGNPSSGQPDASISGVSFNSENATYTSSLTSTGTIELVEISADFNGISVSDAAQVEIVVPNTWEPAGGPTNTRDDWTNDNNWSQDQLPDENDFVVIPDTDPMPELDLNISVGSFEVQNGAELTLLNGNTITIDGNLTIDGILDIEDNTSITVGGNMNGSGTFTAGESSTIEVNNDISITSLVARSANAVIRLNGENQQTISTLNFLAEQLEVRNDVLATGSNLIDNLSLDISEEHTFELQQDSDITLDIDQNITGTGTLLLNNNTMVLGGDTELDNIDAKQGTVVFGVRQGQDPANFNLSRQQITNLNEVQNAIINNDQDVRTFDDIAVEGELTLQNGQLIIASGKSLIAPNQTYNNGSLNIQRRISRQGWYMFGAPINSDFADLFDGLTVQGMTNSTYPNRQPNLLYYNETIEGTDNQRWRTPDDLNNSIQDPDSTGRGFFFYVFGDVENDTDYNDSLPLTLNISGEEYQHQSDTFTFSSVTYTAEADTGFNLVSNPWASTIDWDNDNWTKTNIDNVIYIWDPSSNDYLTWNGIDGSLDNGLIKPFQAFWIKANGEDPVLTADKSAKTTGGEFYSKSDKKPASIEFLLQADTLSKETHITLTPDGSNGKDRKDAFRLLPFETGTYLEIFTTRDDGTQLSINNLARSFGKELTIPLHVGGYKESQPLNGEYTLSWPQLGEVPEEWTMNLIDQKNDEKIDLRKNSFYSFSLSRAKSKTGAKKTMQNFRLTQKSQPKAKNKSGSSENRFLLRIDPGADAAGIPDEYALDLNYPNPFSEKTTIQYNTPEEGEVELMVYDILGRKIKTLVDERRPPDFHKIEWTPSQLASGLYICVMRAGGKQFTKKMTYIK